MVQITFQVAESNIAAFQESRDAHLASAHFKATDDVVADRTMTRMKTGVIMRGVET